MIIPIRLPLLAVHSALFCLAFTLAGLPSLQAEENQDRRPPKEKWKLVTLRGTITSIFPEIREIIIKGDGGKLVTVKAGDGVKRFDEFKVGDTVTADYWAYFKAEFRDPTADEKAVPIVVLAEGLKAPEGFPPGAAVGAVIKAVVKVELVMKSVSEITVKGPRGNYVTFPVEDKALLDQVKEGEVAILTYAEALLLTLEKVQ